MRSASSCSHQCRHPSCVVCNMLATFATDHGASRLAGCNACTYLSGKRSHWSNGERYRFIDKPVVRMNGMGRVSGLVGLGVWAGGRAGGTGGQAGGQADGQADGQGGEGRTGRWRAGGQMDGRTDRRILYYGPMGLLIGGGLIGGWLGGWVAGWLRGCVAAWLGGWVGVWVYGCLCINVWVGSELSLVWALDAFPVQ